MYSHSNHSTYSMHIHWQQHFTNHDSVALGRWRIGLTCIVSTRVVQVVCVCHVLNSDQESKNKNTIQHDTTMVLYKNKKKRRKKWQSFILKKRNLFSSSLPGKKMPFNHPLQKIVSATIQCKMAQRITNSSQTYKVNLQSKTRRLNAQTNHIWRICKLIFTEQWCKDSEVQSEVLWILMPTQLCKLGETHIQSEKIFN